MVNSKVVIGIAAVIIIIASMYYFKLFDITQDVDTLFRADGTTNELLVVDYQQHLVTSRQTFSAGSGCAGDRDGIRNKYVQKFVWIECGLGSDASVCTNNPSATKKYNDAVKYKFTSDSRAWTEVVGQGEQDVSTGDDIHLYTGWGIMRWTKSDGVHVGYALQMSPTVNSIGDHYCIYKWDVTFEEARSCTPSDYTCTNWTSCQPSNQQTRTCSLTSGVLCEGLNPPPTTQSCTYSPIVPVPGGKYDISYSIYDGTFPNTLGITSTSSGINIVEENNDLRISGASAFNYAGKVYFDSSILSKNLNTNISFDVKSLSTGYSGPTVGVLLYESKSNYLFLSYFDTGYGAREDQIRIYSQNGLVKYPYIGSITINKIKLVVLQDNIKIIINDGIAQDSVTNPFTTNVLVGISGMGGLAGNSINGLVSKLQYSNLPSPSPSTSPSPSPTPEPEPGLPLPIEWIIIGAVLIIGIGGFVALRR